MRHDAASPLLADGATPAVVQRQLRHSGPRITLGIYAHVVGSQQRDAVENGAAHCEARGELVQSAPNALLLPEASTKHLES